MNREDERLREVDRELARNERLLTVAQAVRESGVSEITLRRHITKGALKVQRVGPFRRIRIRRSELNRYLGAENLSSH
jgi:excisionase family DNA binding protein